MSRSRSDCSREPPTRQRYDRETAQLTVVVDTLPAALEDLTVAVGPDRLRIAVDHPAVAFDREIEPPASGLAFADERSAVYANGVLEVTVETTTRASR